MSYPEHSLSYPLYSGAVSEFCNLTQQGNNEVEYNIGI